MRDMKLAYLLTSILACLFTSCFKPPDIKMIGEDLGIQFPKEYSIVRYDADPFGLGADADITYVFKFDEAIFKELIKSIKRSALYNVSAEKDFKALPLNRKVEIIKTLAANKMTSYWIATDSAYKYNGDDLFLNDRDQPCKEASELDIYLPNYDKDGASADGYPLKKYSVEATLDIQKRTLHYHYVHI